VAAFKKLLFDYTNDNSRFCVVDDMMIHYRDEGQGETVVLLHGAFSSLHTYNDWAAILRKHYRVVRLDLMGFGLTGPNSSGDYTMSNHIRVLKRFLNILDINQCHLVGSSLGGWLAWEFAFRYPEWVNKLILIGSAGFVEQEAIPLPFRLAQTPLASRVIRYVVRKSILEQFVKQVYFDIEKVNSKLVDRYFDLFTREGNQAAFVKLVNSPYRDNTNYLKKIQNPTFIMWGKEDEWIPVTYAYRFYNQIPDTSMQIYSKVGHLPMEEIPQQSGEDVLKFLQGKFVE